MTEKDLHVGDCYESQNVGIVVLRDKGMYDGLFSYHFYSLEYNTHHYWMTKQLVSKLKDFELEKKGQN